MASVVRLGDGAVLKNVEIPSGCNLFIGEGTDNVTIENVSSSGINTDRPEIYYGENVTNVTIDGQKVR